MPFSSVGFQVAPDVPGNPAPRTIEDLFQSPNASKNRPGRSPRVGDAYCGDLLYGPAVAVRIVEEDERAPVELLDLADLDPSFDELRMCRMDVRDHELKTLGGARPHVATKAGPKGDRAGRPGRRELDEPDLIADPMVMVRMEADLLGVERLRPVHVRDGNLHQFEPPVHDERDCTTASNSLNSSLRNS